LKVQKQNQNQEKRHQLENSAKEGTDTEILKREEFKIKGN
jgi:hypothetical protein